MANKEQVEKVVYLEYLLEQIIPSLNTIAVELPKLNKPSKDKP